MLYAWTEDVLKKRVLQINPKANKLLCAITFPASFYSVIQADFLKYNAQSWSLEDFKLFA